MTKRLIALTFAPVRFAGFSVSDADDLHFDDLQG